MALNLYIQKWDGKYAVATSGRLTEEELKKDLAHQGEEGNLVAFRSFDGEGRVADAAEALASIMSLSDVAADFEEIFTWIANAAADAKAVEIAKRITG